MKTKTIFSLLIAIIINSDAALAEFEVSPSITVASEKKIIASSDIPLPSQAKPSTRKKLASSSKHKQVKEFNVNKKKLFRCWQYGELILAENGFANPAPKGQTLLSKGGQKLTGFDFGETFCLYMGE